MNLNEIKQYCNEIGYPVSTKISYAGNVIHYITVGNVNLNLADCGVKAGHYVDRDNFNISKNLFNKYLNLLNEYSNIWKNHGINISGKTFNISDFENLKDEIENFDLYHPEFDIEFMKNN